MHALLNQVVHVHHVPPTVLGFQAYHHWDDGLFSMVSNKSQAHAIVYYAHGDSPDLHKDVATAANADTCMPIVFWLANDQDYVPSAQSNSKCASNMIFLSSYSPRSAPL